MKLEKKTQIMEAALDAYMRYGIHGATIRQIADSAGIGKSTVFEYFKSGGELMDAAFSHYFVQAAIVRGKLREVAAADPQAALSGYLDNLMKLVLTQPEWLLLVSQYVTAILSTGKDFNEVKSLYAEKLLPSADSLLEDFRFIVEAGLRQGAFRPAFGADPTDYALILNAIAREMQSQAFVREESEIHDTCQRLRRMAFRMLGINDATILEV